MTQYVEVLTDYPVVKSSFSACVFLEKKTWTQNYVLKKLTYVAYCIALKRDPLNKK